MALCVRCPNVNVIKNSLSLFSRFKEYSKVSITNLIEIAAVA